MPVFGYAKRTARKSHRCIACMQIYEHLGEDPKEWGRHVFASLTEEDIKVWEDAKKNDYKILPGQTYERWVWEDGYVQEIKVIPEVNNLCSKLECWDED